VISGDLPFSTHAWDTGRSAFTEVADAYAFAKVGLAYNEVNSLARGYSTLANVAESKGMSLKELADDRGQPFLSRYPNAASMPSKMRWHSSIVTAGWRKGRWTTPNSMKRVV
jgi:hypothetical protein